MCAGEESEQVRRREEKILQEQVVEEVRAGRVRGGEIYKMSRQDRQKKGIRGRRPMP